MGSQDLLMTWLLENVKEQRKGKLIFRELFESKRTCMFSQTKFARILRLAFPQATVNRRRVSGRHETIFRGIAKIDKEKVAPAEECSLEELQNFIPNDVMVQPSENNLTLIIGSSVFVNDNMVVKTVKLSKNEWELWVRGHKVDLKQHDLDFSFVPSKENMLRIIDCVKKMQICKGFPFMESMVGHRSVYIKEKCKSGNESETYVTHCHCCTYVTALVSKTSICRKCQQAFQRWKNFEVKPDKEDNNSMEELLNQCFPNASKEMKILLQAQQNQLATESRYARRWDKNVVRMCLSLWIRSPPAYRKLLDSNVLILPCGRQMRRYYRRYKKIVKQDGCSEADALRRMFESAKDAEGGSDGPAGRVMHGKTKAKVKRSNTSRKLIRKKQKGKKGRKIVKNKGKNKGKRKAKKKVAQWPCGGCNSECTKDSVCCDACNIWFHYQCVGLSGDDEELKKDKWFCFTCTSLSLSCELEK